MIRGLGFSHWIERSGKVKLHGFTMGFQRVFDQYVGRCHFVIDAKGGICGRPVYERRHVISRASVPDLLKDKRSGKILEMEWHVAEWQRLYLGSDEEHPINLADPATFSPRAVGTHDACTRPLACGLHDPEFHSLDIANPDFSDPNVRLQALHRIVLCGLDLRLHEKSLLNNWRRTVMRNSSLSQRVLWLKRIEENKTALCMAWNTSLFLGKAWYAVNLTRESDPGLTTGQVLGFRSKLRFAASVLSKDGAAILVFPEEEDIHKMVVMYPTRMADSLRADCELVICASGISQTDDNYGVDVLEAILGNSSGMVAASPESYSRLQESQRLRINRVMYDSFGMGPLLEALSLPPEASRRRPPTKR